LGNVRSAIVGRKMNGKKRMRYIAAINVGWGKGNPPLHVKLRLITDQQGVTPTWVLQ